MNLAAADYKAARFFESWNTIQIKGLTMKMQEKTEKEDYVSDNARSEGR
jgi:hypothetical protein